MTRLSITLPQSYPRRFVWWMECDACRLTQSSPEWSENHLSLERFRDEGWRCQDNSPLDTCPSCIAKEVAA